MCYPVYKKIKLLQSQSGVWWDFENRQVGGIKLTRNWKKWVWVNPGSES